MMTKLELFTVFSILVLFSITDCTQKPSTAKSSDRSVQVYNYDNANQLQEYERRNLDASHPNLLDPQNSKEQIQQVMESWTGLHQDIADFLAEKNFTWDTDQASISILHKIYFHPDGKIKAHFFRVFNHQIPDEKKQAFASLLKEFSSNHAISFSQKQAFAQCGKTRYPN